MFRLFTRTARLLCNANSVYAKSDLEWHFSLLQRQIGIFYFKKLIKIVFQHSERRQIKRVFVMFCLHDYGRQHCTGANDHQATLLYDEIQHLSTRGAMYV